MLTLLSALDHHACATPDKPALIVARRGAYQQFSFADPAFSAKYKRLTRRKYARGYQIVRHNESRL